MLQGVLESLRPAVVALIFAAGLNMLLQVVFGGRAQISLESLHWTNAIMCAAALIALRKIKMNPILVMLLCGLCGLLSGAHGV